MNAEEHGERRHETCKFGRLTETWAMSGGWSSMPWSRERVGTPGLAPLCMWTPADPHPPAVARAWGGLVSFERDCAVCRAHSVVEVEA